jgi:hypothetical protein
MGIIFKKKKIYFYSFFFFWKILFYNLITNLISHIWFPWINLLAEHFILQFFILYFSFSMLNSNNTYYTLCYFFLNIIVFGLFFGIMQLELFLAFFWLIEFTVIFVSLLLVFYLNVEGEFNKQNKILSLFNSYFVFFSYFIFLICICIFEKKIQFVFFFFFYDNFYQSNYLFLLNDFTAVFFSYYIYNSFEFLLLGFLLFVVSIIVINLNLFFKKNKINSYVNVLNIFSTQQNFLNYSFIRKQNLIKQNHKMSSIRIFKVKKNI